MDSLFFRKIRTAPDFRAMLRKLLRNKRVVAGLIVGVPLLLLVLFGNRGVVQRVRLHGQKAELAQKVLAEEAEGKRLRAEIKALDGDRKAIEKVAREKHGMIRKGETVYVVKRDK